LNIFLGCSPACPASPRVDTEFFSVPLLFTVARVGFTSPSVRPILLSILVFSGPLEGSVRGLLSSSPPPSSPDDFLFHHPPPSPEGGSRNNYLYLRTFFSTWFSLPFILLRVHPGSLSFFKGRTPSRQGSHQPISPFLSSEICQLSAYLPKHSLHPNSFLSASFTC